MSIENNQNEEAESFRDHLATVDETGKRKWIYVQEPKGKLYNYRTILSVFYLIVLFALPFLKVNGHPLFLFNVLERKFILFGVTFWPQDFFIFGVGMITFLVFIVLFTVIFGRVFCGWACPQTIFMEMVFRRIEYWIEGNNNQQRVLNNGPWTNKKIFKKTLKHTIFFAISFLIANIFLSYIIGIDELIKIISEPVNLHMTGFIAILAFSFVFYGVFAYMREQVCIAICPYGRLQGVLLDKDSVVVAYDRVRGEDRGKFRKNETRTIGDCIDCYQCVKVCPTGIDIRNGTQLECVNCTACIDACDHMMDNVGLPRGLIRFASENNITKKEKFSITPRIKAYSAVLVLLIGAMVFMLVTRKDLNATVTRVGGMLYQKQDNNRVSNLYNIKLLNKTQHNLPIVLKVENANAEVRVVGKELLAISENTANGTFFIILPKKEINARKTELQIGVYSGEKKIETVKTSFMGPLSE
ncbi:cytochrome c oxidase accessory protein CcoG [Solitalea canadensis]|uniref:Cytochrome c oxidase accessory protein FixG n=1 Tax=Solitalea canadensis (strain ATCC 29591 / DSM 3403 / JCM 21819 / LMG 8368 / NBRC 15130 / NCIMB 12057 / USAM 9D) TaxID=929556 RepID=H8KTM2_SOLCM|nr:cytochrome c oxidase accessory protein CcoG [Solitalea canadensis]AFD06480.1 cytochrome c oxidase accessory protein FixG [Solitalea canadensis DSM 3403]